MQIQLCYACAISGLLTELGVCIQGHLEQRKPMLALCKVFPSYLSQRGGSGTVNLIHGITAHHSGTWCHFVGDQSLTCV
jgi:hypothetical protein